MATEPRDTSLTREAGSQVWGIAGWAGNRCERGRLLSLSLCLLSPPTSQDGVWVGAHEPALQVRPRGFFVRAFFWALCLLLSSLLMCLRDWTLFEFLLWAQVSSSDSIYISSFCRKPFHLCTSGASQSCNTAVMPPLALPPPYSLWTPIMIFSPCVAPEPWLKKNNKTASAT